MEHPAPIPGPSSRPTHGSECNAGGALPPPASLCADEVPVGSHGAKGTCFLPPPPLGNNHRGPFGASRAVSWGDPVKPGRDQGRKVQIKVGTRFNAQLTHASLSGVGLESGMGEWGRELDGAAEKCPADLAVPFIPPPFCHTLAGRNGASFGGSLVPSSSWWSPPIPKASLGQWGGKDRVVTGFSFLS